MISTPLLVSKWRTGGTLLSAMAKLTTKTDVTSGNGCGWTSKGSPKSISAGGGGGGGDPTLGLGGPWTSAYSQPVYSPGMFGNSHA